MPKNALRKVKWTLAFDSALKSMVVKAARRKGVQPGTLIEDLVRKEFNPFGYGDVKDSVAYVTAIRKKNRKQSDEAFLAEIEASEKSRSGSTRVRAFR